MTKITVFLFAILILSFCSCDSRLDFSLENAGENEDELEKVLEHFENDPNPLKYEATKFLIENMPYHLAYYGSEAERFQNVYTIMSKNAQDEIIRREEMNTP